MRNQVQDIQFQNSQNPNSPFDLIKLEELMLREIEHDITQIHKIHFYHILLITDGKGFHTIDFTDYAYQKGSLLTIRKDQLQKFFRSPSVKGYVLIFTEDFLASHFSEIEVIKSIQLFNELLTMPKIELDEAAYNDILQLVHSIEKEYFESYDEFSVGIIRSALHMLIIKLFRIKTNNSNIFLKRKYVDEFVQLQQLIEQDCFETKRVMDYAKKMNCTPKTLNNIVKNILGISAKTLIDEVLITQIKRLLINTAHPIKEIAYTTGFDDPTNFYRYFKKYTQTTPELFRKAH